MTTTQNRNPKGVKLPATWKSCVSQFLITNFAFQYVRGEPPHWGTARAGTEGKAPGAAASTIGGAA